MASLYDKYESDNSSDFESYVSDENSLTNKDEMEEEEDELYNNEYYDERFYENQYDKYVVSKKEEIPERVFTKVDTSIPVVNPWKINTISSVSKNMNDIMEEQKVIQKEEMKQREIEKEKQKVEMEKERLEKDRQRRRRQENYKKRGNNFNRRRNNNNFSQKDKQPRERRSILNNMKINS